MKDLEAIDLLTRNLYAAISFEEGGKPDLDRLKDLFLSPGNLINNNEAHPMIWNLEAFIETYRQQLSGGALHSFIEEEISDQTEIFGSVAHRFSTYQTRFR